MKKSLIILLAILIALPLFAVDLKTTGQIRFRGCYIDKETGTDVDYYTQRTWLGVMGNVVENIDVQIVGEYENNWGKTIASPGVGVNGSGFTLVLGNVTVKNLFNNEALSLKLGRQGYGLTNKFIVWDDENSLDGMILSYKPEKWNIGLVMFKIADNQTTQDERVSGLTVEYNGFTNNTVTGYYLLGDARGTDDDANFLGLNVKGMYKKLAYNAEYIKQGGENSNVDIDADLIYGDVNYSFEDMKELKVGLDYLAMSGDDNSTTDNEAFQSGATDHMLNGAANFDPNGPDGARSAGVTTTSNIDNLGIYASIKLFEKMTFGAKYSMMSKNEVAAGASDDLGNNIDVYAKYPVATGTSLCAVYSSFSADDNSALQDCDFSGLEFRVNF